MIDVISREPIISVICTEPEGTVVRSVYKVIWTPEKLKQFWDLAKKFPSVFGIEIYENPRQFIDMFFSINDKGEWSTDQLFFEVDDMIGLLRVDNIKWPDDASVHYTFFDRRHKGRIPLLREMLKWLFDNYKFSRFSTAVPSYVKSNIRHFILDIGFFYEGKKRNAVTYKGRKFDVNLYSIFPYEIEQAESRDNNGIAVQSTG